VFFPYAREQGLGRAFNGEAGALQVAIATATAAAAVAAFGPRVAIQAGAALVVALVLALWLRARLGGLTGDVYGALVEIAEVVALVAAAVR
jgi:adenosylcobinamide-GDP ribazoletransferase